MQQKYRVAIIIIIIQVCQSAIRHKIINCFFCTNFHLQLPTATLKCIPYQRYSVVGSQYLILPYWRSITRNWHQVLLHTKQKDLCYISRISFVNETELFRSYRVSRWLANWQLWLFISLAGISFFCYIHTTHKLLATDSSCGCDCSEARWLVGVERHFQHKWATSRHGRFKYVVGNSTVSSRHSLPSICTDPPVIWRLSSLSERSHSLATKLQKTLLRRKAAQLASEWQPQLVAPDETIYWSDKTIRTSRLSET